MNKEMRHSQAGRVVCRSSAAPTKMRSRDMRCRPSFFKRASCSRAGLHFAVELTTRPEHV